MYKALECAITQRRDFFRMRVKSMLERMLPTVKMTLCLKAASEFFSTSSGPLTLWKTSSSHLWTSSGGLLMFLSRSEGPCGVVWSYSGWIGYRLFQIRAHAGFILFLARLIAYALATAVNLRLSENQSMLRHAFASWLTRLGSSSLSLDGAFAPRGCSGFCWGSS